MVPRCISLKTFCAFGRIEDSEYKSPYWQYNFKLDDLKCSPVIVVDFETVEIVVLGTKSAGLIWITRLCIRCTL